MASQISPGILLRERDITTATIVGAQALTGAIATTFTKGPVDRITSIDSQRALIDTFGLPVEANADDWLVASEFLSYGGRLAVVRALTNGIKTANVGGSELVVNTDLDWIGNNYPNEFAARSPGKWGNSAAIIVVDSGADVYVEFDSAPLDSSQNPLSVGDSVTFSNGASGYVLSYEASATKWKAAIVITSGDEPSTGDFLQDDNLDPIATITDDAVVEVGRTPGSYTGLTAQGDTRGATFDVTVADAGVEGGGPASGEGGSVTVTLSAAGNGYSDNEELILTGASTGDGSDITVTVLTTTNDTEIIAVYDWWTNTSVAVGTSGLTVDLSALGIRPGTSAYASARGIVGDEVAIAVIDIDGRISGTVGNVVERVTSLSKLTDGRSTENGAVYYKDIINQQSSYIFSGSNSIDTALTSSSTGDARYIPWSQDSVVIVDAGNNRTFEVSGVVVYYLENGADDYVYTAGEITAAYDKFSSSDETDVDFVLMGGSMATEDETKAKAAKVVAIADARKDAIAFVSPHKGNQIGTGGISLSSAQQRTNTINFFRSLPSTSYAVFDSGYKYLYDRFNDKFRYIPCNGDVAGLCVSTSAQLGDWYSPAGVARGGLKNAVKLAYNPSAADRDQLYTNRINPITTLPGTGITLFGDKTALASTSAFDRINVRRLFLNIERRVERLASGVLFEQNDVLTRSSFSSAVNSYLSEVQARRGVTDFLVVCDETNNTPDVIDRNEFVAEILLKPSRSINFVSITFTATKTGVTFAEVVGR